jgi:hypothetical protein
MCAGEASVADLAALCLDHGRPAKQELLQATMGPSLDVLDIEGVALKGEHYV